MVCSVLKIYQFACLNDNYGFLIQDEGSGLVATIDTPDGDAIIQKANSLGLKIDVVWNTHWHPDHAGGNAKIREVFGAKIYGPKEVSDHGFVCDEIIAPNQSINLGNSVAKIIDVSAHTMGHIAFYFETDKVAFVGDALFALGCGRLFEGTAEQAWSGLNRIMEFDDETQIYCAHEYSLANAAFCESLGLSNKMLVTRIDAIKQMRAENIPTVPFKLGLERATSPYLLADRENLVREIGLVGKSDSEIFAFIRKAKDNF